MPNDSDPDPIANTQAFRAFAHESEQEPRRGNRNLVVAAAVVAFVIAAVIAYLVVR